jgi:hypothetical protein
VWLALASSVSAVALVAWPARWIWGCALRPDLAYLPVAWIAGAGAAWLGGWLLLAGVAMIPARGQVLVRLRTVRFAVLLIPATLAVVSLTSPIAEGHSLVAPDRATWLSVATQCVAAALVTALCPIVLATRALRRAAPEGATAVAAAIGASGAALGGLALHLHCPWAAPSHVLAGHVLPMALAAGLVAWLGRPVLVP